MHATDANAVPVTDDPRPLAPMGGRPTFHLSHGTVCFLGGIAVALGVMWLMTQMQKGKRD